MMSWANVSEEMLKKKGEIKTNFGETLSWDYLCFVREHSISWSVPTDILYAEKDNNHRERFCRAARFGGHRYEKRRALVSYQRAARIFRQMAFIINQ